MQSNRRVMRKADMKVVLLGDTSVGKTSLVLRYIDRKFQDSVSTIGAAFLLKQWGNYSISIWDTAGEEKYSGLSSFYCRNASAAVLVFDLTTRKSFDVLRTRYLPLLDSSGGAILKIVAGSKLDLVASCNREVSTEEGRSFAKSINPTVFSNGKVPYFETSSRTGSGIDELFEFAFEQFFPSQGTRPRPPTPNKQGYQHLDKESVSLSEDVKVTSGRVRCCR